MRDVHEWFVGKIVRHLRRFRKETLKNSMKAKENSTNFCKYFTLLEQLRANLFRAAKKKTSLAKTPVLQTQIARKIHSTKIKQIGLGTHTDTHTHTYR